MSAPMDDLIARLEGGADADRGLDGCVARALSGSKDHWFSLAGDLMTEETAPPYTASLDAAVAFVERMLPGWLWSVSACGVAWATVTAPPNRIGYWTGGHKSSPARALTAAALRALAQMEQSNG